MNDDSELPALGTKPPLLREHRLYQADWLLRFYGFEASELLTEERPYFHRSWTRSVTGQFATWRTFRWKSTECDYTQILQDSRIGVKSARRIVQGKA